MSTEMNTEMNTERILTVKGAITITFSGCVENAYGMKQHGDKHDEGMSYKEMKFAEKELRDKGIEVEMIDLVAGSGIKKEECEGELEGAWVLIARKLAQRVCVEGGKEVGKEVGGMKFDEKKLLRGRVVNSKARRNNCITDKEIEADIKNGQGTVLSFANLPALTEIRQFIGGLAETDKFDNLYAEGNWYYESKNCYIGYHGDVERNNVCAVRFGDSLGLSFCWFRKSKPFGRVMNVMLNEGDFYMMSRKAVGTDWRKRNKNTLRHCVNRNKGATKDTGDVWRFGEGEPRKLSEDELNVGKKKKAKKKVEKKAKKKVEKKAKKKVEKKVKKVEKKVKKVEKVKKKKVAMREIEVIDLTGDDDVIRIEKIVREVEVLDLTSD